MEGSGGGKRKNILGRYSRASVERGRREAMEEGRGRQPGRQAGSKEGRWRVRAWAEKLEEGRGGERRVR